MRSRMRRLLLLIALIAMLLPITIHAQETAPAWYYAWNGETGEVFAYNAAGESKLLLTADEVYPVSWRMADGGVLAVFSVGGTVDLYHVTGDTAAALIASVPDLPLDSLNRMVAQHGNY